MPNHEIGPYTFKCAVDGCKAKPIKELWEDFDGRTLFLSVCDDPEHQTITRDFLTEKGDIGRACIEFENRNHIHNDTDLTKGREFDIALRQHLRKLIDRGDI